MVKTAETDIVSPTVTAEDPLNVGNAKLQKTSSNASITDGNGNYSVAGATYGVFADKDLSLIHI